MGTRYPGLTTPERNTIFELLQDGKADISASPIVLTQDRSQFLPYSVQPPSRHHRSHTPPSTFQFPIFTFPYAFVTTSRPPDAVNFQLLKVWPLASSTPAAQLRDECSRST